MMPSPGPRKNFKANYLRSRVVESSDSELDEKPGNRRQSTHSIRLSQTTESLRISQVTQEEETQPDASWKTRTYHSLTKQTSSMVVEVDSDSTTDDAVLVFDEPKSARKPIPKQKSKAKVFTTVSVEGTKARVTFSSSSNELFEPDAPDVDTDTEPTPNPPAPRAKNPSPKKKLARTPRVTNKKRKQDQQEELRSYAQTLFAEINRTVFQQQLPEDTKLNWNKRLLTTAGRAKWHRSKEGVQTAEIELAEKILTSSERIRNTLSHEMCHLASWIMDKEIKEAHGKFWKAWTRRVMQKYPDIDISTRHDYNIEHPYKWKCAKCDKIYGRFSKSIKPDECLCGACREGRLIPQFTTNPRAPKTPKMSRMAATKAQDSPFTPTTCGPLSTPSTSAVGEVICISSGSENNEDVQVPARPYHSKASICEIPGGDDDSDSEIEILATTFRTATIDDLD
ncbi:hypothetical protein FA13DRAFT_1725086 [Coprinellus micaceus]|uniref:SprT-like domain-containing protein n=1 Tax=Coprinellus micaceus TaxID=71717 RepID=A0A4Y7TY81_COPMI|nr:hypothetical protein FA13DRAFT_1725086 [Coprinellus micaceus]